MAANAEARNGRLGRSVSGDEGGHPPMAADAGEDGAAIALAADHGAAAGKAGRFAAAERARRAKRQETGS
jgi:hypothetical protein